jgi:hypothetical protein
MAETAVGASGVVVRVTGLLAAEAKPVPTLLVAVTVKVYVVRLLRPVTLQVVEGAMAVQVLAVSSNVVTL